MKQIGLVAIAALGTVACTSRLPPPRVPDRQVPELATTPAPPGRGLGQVIVDATNGPARVSLILSAFTLHTGRGTFSSLTARPLCPRTPCAVALGYGTYNLLLQSQTDPELISADAVQVGTAPSIFRHTMGRNTSSPVLMAGGITALSLGLSGALTGAIVLPLDERTGLHAFGLYSLGIGAAVTAVGAVLMYMGRSEVQPGSSVQWTPDGPVPTPDMKQVVQVSPTGVRFNFN